MALPTPFSDASSRWRAITRRDPDAHFAFLYGVTSTKIYCRPTCTARCARRANVVFYDTVEQAVADGFRACQRCKPDEVLFMGDREQTVGRTIALLREHVAGGGDGAMKKSVKALAKEVGVTPSYLCRVFKQVMGVTIGKYVDDFEGMKPPIDSWMMPSIDVWSDHTGESQLVGEKMTCGPPATENAAPLTDAASFPGSAITSWSTQGPETSHSSSSDTDRSSYAPLPCLSVNEPVDFNMDDWIWTESFDSDEWSPHN